jgi:hypothetical protein
VGIVVGLIGYKLSASYEIISTVAAPVILISLGVILPPARLRAEVTITRTTIPPQTALCRKQEI